MSKHTCKIFAEELLSAYKTGLSSGTVGNSSHVDAMFNLAEKMLPSIEAAISAL